MIRLLNIEFKKILTYKVFWVLIGLYFLFLALGILMAEFMLNHMVDEINKHTPIPLPHVNIYFFPDVWQNITFFASIRYVLIFPAIIIIILITNEFTYKTVRQNIINGMSKTEFILSKLLFILVQSVIITLFVGIASIIIGFSHTSNVSLSLVLEKSAFIFGFFLTIFTIQIYAFFFGFILRNTGLSIALFTLYAFIAEPVIYYLLKSPIFIKNNISTYLPFNSVLRLTEYPAIPVLKKIMGLNLQDGISGLACMIAFLYALVMTGIVVITFRKKDL